VDVCELYEQKDRKGLERIEGKFFLGTDRTHYWKFDDKEGPNGLAATKTDYTTNKVVARKTGQVKHALVHIGPDGTPLGYAYEKNGGHPITRSCWQSFKMGPKPRW